MKTTNGYSRLQITLHWLIVLLIGVNYIVSDQMGRYLRTQLQGGTVTATTPTIHVYVGIAVLVLVVIRFLVRTRRGVPAEPASGSALMQAAGRYTHWALYALMALVPALGMGAWYLGVRQMGDAHVVLMNLMIILALMHAAAALFHQYILKDRLLLRMMRPE